MGSSALWVLPKKCIINPNRGLYQVFSRHYQIIDILHDNITTVVYRARRSSDGHLVIVKMIKLGALNEHTIAQFMNEHYILSSLKSPKIVKIIEAITHPSEYFHVFEDIGGRSLYDLFHERRFELSEGLSIAIKIAETLSFIHKKHVIHSDINPKNIIYNPDTKAVQIIDFGYSLMDNHLRFNVEANVGNSGNLMYMSPEQTGKTKQQIDYRSDWYSFGMSLYHLFSGRTPFEAKDRFELVHKQIALYPTPIDAVVENFPRVLGEIIARLIAKNPDERYQNDDALIHDLKYALQTLDKGGRIPHFEIAAFDRPLFRFGDRLYGREEEISLLKNAAARVTSGHPVKLAVSGVPGVGKTRLIEEFLTFLSAGGALIVRGKFEPYRSAHPYLSFKQLLSQLKTTRNSPYNTAKKITMDPRSAEALYTTFPEIRHLLPLKSPPPIHAA